jgi:hypothetical protein
MTIRVEVRHGLLTLQCGVVAFLRFCFLAHRRRLGQLVGGKLLSVLDSIGLVRQQRSYIVEMKPRSILSLDDANEIVWMTWLACMLTGASIVLALLAEYRRESTLYLSAGFMVATAGAGLVSPFGMLVLRIVGFLALVIIRRQHASAT